MSNTNQDIHDQQLTEEEIQDALNDIPSSEQSIISINNDDNPHQIADATDSDSSEDKAQSDPAITPTTNISEGKQGNKSNKNILRTTDKRKVMTAEEFWDFAHKINPRNNFAVENVLDPKTGLKDPDKSIKRINGMAMTEYLNNLKDTGAADYNPPENRPTPVNPLVVFFIDPLPREYQLAI